MIRKTLRRISGAGAPALILPLVAFLFFAVLSCGGGTAPKVGIVYDSTGRGDGSFNDSAYEGVKMARAEFGAVVSERTTDGTDSDREDMIRSLAGENDLVIALGFSFEKAVKKVAAEYPDTNFAGVDILQRDDSPPNFASLLFNEAEGSFLVGIAAGYSTGTDRIGFIGGVCGTPDGIIEKFEAGFVEGVLTVAKTVQRDFSLRTRYLSQFTDSVNGRPDISGFNDPGRAKAAAGAMFKAGADIVFHAAGASGAGLFEAARDFSAASGKKVWAIGVDSDQYLTAEESVREYILTSMLKRVDTAVYNIIKAQRDGEFSGGEVISDLSNDGVGYAVSGGFIEDVVRVHLETARDFVVGGISSVPTKPTRGCGEPQTYDLRYPEAAAGASGNAAARPASAGP